MPSFKIHLTRLLASLFVKINHLTAGKIQIVKNVGKRRTKKALPVAKPEAKFMNIHFGSSEAICFCATFCWLMMDHRLYSVVSLVNQSSRTLARTKGIKTESGG